MDRIFNPPNGLSRSLLHLTMATFEIASEHRIGISSSRRMKCVHAKTNVPGKNDMSSPWMIK